MDILISIAAKVAEYTVAPIGRQLGYLFWYKQNVDDLNTKIVDLRNVKESLQHDVDEAQRKGEIIEAGVNEWLTKVDKIITEDHENFSRDDEQANTKCISAAKFPNPVLRHRLSRRAKKMAEKVATQIQDREKIQKVAYRRPLPNSVKNKRIYEAFESRNQALTAIMKALRDPSVSTVGVWGMGGVGKTMLAKEVARRAKEEENLFTTVVFTAISKDPVVEKIQQEIGEKLGMQFPEESKDARAERLGIRLREENNLLIILDDIWDQLDLEDVGISFGIDQKSCKILLTTRYSHVLANDMGVDKNAIFRVGDLLEHEAMSLFSKIVGNQAEIHDDDFRDLATQIVKECGRLPIAITTVGSALKNKEFAVWENALQELKNSNPVNIQGMHEKVYTSIKFSYDHLKSAEAKYLLLLCSLFPEDAIIPVEEVLCKYGIGLNLFEGVNTLQKARNKTVTLVANLTEHSLLLDGDDDDDDVKLHDVVRDVVIFIASQLDDHHRMYNIRADELDAYVNKEMFKDSTAISLYYREADQYPQTLKTPGLKLLRMVQSDGEENSGKVPHQLFEGLNRLLVLDSLGVSLEPLPAASSSCLLSNLQTLRCSWCNLGDISWIGELKNLKILDLSYNFSITELPRGIGKLNRLLSLNLERCDNLKVIEPNVISSLTRLEELNLKDSFQNWEVQGVIANGDERRNANLSEVMNLPRLIDLNLNVPDLNSLPKDIFSEQLKKYYIQIGFDGRDSVYDGGVNKNTSRILKLKLCPNSVLNEHDFKALLKTCDSLTLNGLKSVKSVAFEMESAGFQRLKHLTVDESTEIRCIVYSNMDYQPAAFPSLESLVLRRLMNLENIIHRKLTTETSFGKLTKIEVSNCEKLKSLFLLFNIPKQLKSIQVSECMTMEEIITHHGRGRDHVEKIEISQLQRLRLSELPKLVQFIGTSKSEEIKSEGQFIDDSVAPLFNGQVLFPELNTLFISSLNIRKIWNEDQLTTETSFGKLTEIEVRNCEKLKSLFSLFNIPKHLKSIEVSECTMMEEIITHHGRGGDHDEKIEFSQLQRLSLLKLPKLVQFIATSKSDEIKSEEQSIDDSVAPLFNGQVVFPKLDELSIESLNIRKIWNDNPLSSSRFGFQNLTGVYVTNCDHLKGLIPSFMSASLVHLLELEVTSCEAMKEIVFIEESAQVKGNNTSFPKLEYLRLHNLPNLQRFCGGDCVDCPSLLKLTIIGCPKLRVFVTNNMPTTTTEKEDENSRGSVDEQHLSRRKDVVKVELSTESSSSEITCQPHPLASVEEHHDMVFKTKRLGVLKLWNFPYLPQPPKTFPRSLELLSICEWGIRLKDLATPLMPFQNLKFLTVKDCHDLTSLLSPSTAKSLSQQLTRLGISGCKSLTQVIANDHKEADDDDHEIIIFSQLKFLLLDDLSSLTSFYSGNNNVVLQFPHLDKLIVGRCPEMKTFYHGNIDCPSLHKIFLCKSNDGDEIRIIMRYPEFYVHKNFEHSYWKGDINATIQKLWEDKNIGDSPESEENAEEDHEVDP